MVDFPTRFLMMAPCLTLFVLFWLAGNSIYADAQLSKIMDHYPSKLGNGVAGKHLSELSLNMRYMLYASIFILVSLMIAWYYTLRGLKRWQREVEVGRLKMAAYAEQISQREREAARYAEELETQQGALIASKETAEKANRSKSDFLSNMSHELRTPMHSIMNHADIGLRSLEKLDLEKGKKCLSNIHVSGKRLLNLINDLLDLSKLEAGKMVFKRITADFMSVVTQTLTELDPMLKEKKVRVCIDQQAESTEAYFDPRGMAQVMVNLISNAIRFSPVNSVITIVISAGSKVDGSVHTPCLLCEVRDEGVGIPMNELNAIFDKFVQSSKTKSAAGGTGLGLAICREIMQEHDGEIWAEHNGGEGAVLRFLLPLAPPPEILMEAV